MACGRFHTTFGAWAFAALLAMVVGFGLGAAAPASAAAPLRACEDNIDNDDDGRIDWPEEPGCERRNDPTEADPRPLPQCSNGIDDDLDSPALLPGLLRDFPNDPGCAEASDDTEGANPATQCFNGIDDDGDGLRDFLGGDPGCIAASDNSEVDTACSDNVDNDGDNLVDYPSDLGCAAPRSLATGPNQSDASEIDPPQCDDGRDNDGDGTLDFAPGPTATRDADCDSAADTVEAPPGAPPPPPLLVTLARCSDGADNDGDTKVDFPADPGCSSAGDNEETDPQVVVLPSGGPTSSQSESRVRLLTPFPIVRLRGRADGEGVRISLLTVRAPVNAKVSIYCSGKGCPRRRVAIKAGRKLVRVRQFERRMRVGSALEIYVTKPGYVGKYTRFRIQKNRVPLRVDRCATTPGAKPRNCPSS